MLKEIMEKVKQENIMLNIELSQYKLLGLEEKIKTKPIQDINTELKEMKLDLESAKNENEQLKLELNSRGKGKIKDVPKWILNAKTKGTEGLGYNKYDKKKKVYVDLPSSKVCSFCGKTGHLKHQCLKKEQHNKTNQIYVDRVWIKKYDSCIIDMEPKDGWVPPTNN